MVGTPHHRPAATTMEDKWLTSFACSDINTLIADYLTAEGYPNAAAAFSKEANLSPLDHAETVTQRRKIIHDIHNGNVQSAIEAINELYPQVSLHYFIS
jgi:hypothetical protein